MNIDFDRLKYSLTGEYEEVMLEKQLKEKDKEVERLKNGCKELEQQIDDLYKLETTLTNENERLNNIINELEKWLEVNLTNLEKEKTNNTYDKGLKQGMLSNGRLIKNKLQELKGSEKE